MEGAHLLYVVENVVGCLQNNPRMMGLLTKHCEGFTTGSLPISKDCAYGRKAVQLAPHTRPAHH